jgi:hypothetical protein
MDSILFSSLPQVLRIGKRKLFKLTKRGEGGQTAIPGTRSRSELCIPG